MKDWTRDTDEIRSRIEAKCRPMLKQACIKVLAACPKATYVAVGEGMGCRWIEVDNVHFHYEQEDEDMYHAVGLPSHRGANGHKLNRIVRLRPLREAMESCSEFLDTFNQAFPYVEARR